VLTHRTLYALIPGLPTTKLQIPVASSWTVFAGRFIDPSIGFAVSWSYWFNIITGLASELIAAANVVAYWNDVSVAVKFSIPSVQEQQY
jgi:amino acid permease